MASRPSDSLVWRKKTRPDAFEERQLAGRSHASIDSLRARLREREVQTVLRWDDHCGWVHGIEVDGRTLPAHLAYDQERPEGRLEVPIDQEGALRAVGLPPTAGVPLRLAPVRRGSKQVCVPLDDHHSLRDFEALVLALALVHR